MNAARFLATSNMYELDNFDHLSTFATEISYKIAKDDDLKMRDVHAYFMHTIPYAMKITENDYKTRAVLFVDIYEMAVKLYMDSPVNAPAPKFEIGDVVRYDNDKIPRNMRWATIEGRRWEKDGSLPEKWHYLIQFPGESEIDWYVEPNLIKQEL